MNKSKSKNDQANLFRFDMIILNQSTKTMQNDANEYRQIYSIYSG